MRTIALLSPESVGSNVDPNAVFAAFLIACAERDSLGAQDAADALALWLGSGGFEPKWTRAQKDAFLDFVANFEHDYAN